MHETVSRCLGTCYALLCKQHGICNWLKGMLYLITMPSSIILATPVRSERTAAGSMRAKVVGKSLAVVQCGVVLCVEWMVVHL